MTDQSLGDGVFYSVEDYPGPLLRIAVLFIDGMVLIALWVTISLIVFAAAWAIDPRLDPSAIQLLLLLLATWGYVTLLKRTWGTVAYLLLGLTIVTTRGQRPSLAVMTIRELMWVFGPFNFITDLLWLGPDTERQSLRDCYLGTYVVRRRARPIGKAPMHLVRYHGAGLAPMYPRVARPKAGVT